MLPLPEHAPPQRPKRECAGQVRHEDSRLPEVQHKAGLRQKECGRCGLWKYPQELSDLVDRHEAQSRKGPVTIETAVCNNCAKVDQP